MRVLFIGDIVGRPGREAVKCILPSFKEKHNIDFVIANCENAAGGFGITPNVAQEIIANGVDAITMGNHTWDRKEVKQIINEDYILRPANYTSEVEGKGFHIYEIGKGKVAVISLLGRVYLSLLNCPFRTVSEVLPTIENKTNLIIVDIHAEITSEKVAMGWYLDGKVSAVIGTHTHIQTADERVLPQGTAYITDIGMTGPRDSVIGINKEIIIKKYLTQVPIRFEVAKEDVVFSGVMIDIDEKTGKADKIERFCLPVSID